MLQLGNVIVVKDLQASNVMNAQEAIIVIQTVIDVNVTYVVHVLTKMAPIHAMKMVNVHVKQMSVVKNVINV